MALQGSRADYSGAKLNIAAVSLQVTIGILIASLINYGSQFIHPWGWRLPLALAGVPGLFILMAGLILPDSPKSLLERGKDVEALRVSPTLHNQMERVCMLTSDRKPAELPMWED